LVLLKSVYLTNENLLLVWRLSHTISYFLSKTIDMEKKPAILKPESVFPTHPNIISEEIFKDLEIPQRTQLPPTEELIARLNELASKPPFCYTRKIRKNDPL
jgi:hypothetical protein